MNYWLCISNRINWDVIRKKNIWAVAKKHKNSILKTEIGDKILIYARQERIDPQEIIPAQILGAFEIASKPYDDEKPLFSPQVSQINESFPYRVNIRSIKIFDNPVDFKSTIPDLDFISNKKNWASHLQGRSMRTIPEKDYNTIFKCGTSDLSKNKV